MKRTRRRVTMAVNGVSMFDRWTGARMHGPCAGTCSRPSSVKRVHARQNPNTSERATK